jgi:uncharacterized protein (DUF433 family)
VQFQAQRSSLQPGGYRDAYYKGGLMNVFDRITFDEQIKIGQACIRHTLIEVSYLLWMIAQGYTVEEIIDLHPKLEPEDVQAALEYAAHLTAQRVYPYKN